MLSLAELETPPDAWMVKYMIFTIPIVVFTYSTTHDILLTWLLCQVLVPVLVVCLTKFKYWSIFYVIPARTDVCRGRPQQQMSEDLLVHYSNRCRGSTWSATATGV